MQDPSLYDEAALLSRCAGGDEDAFRALFLHWHQLLAGYLFRITESKELAEDLVQETFLKIWMARESLAKVRHFKAYLLTVSRNNAYDALKKQLKEQMQRRAWEDDAMISPAPEGEEQERSRAALVDAAIDSLPPRRKEVYLLSRHERLTYHEIAERLGISRESVKTHLELANSSIASFIRSRLLQGLGLLTIFFKNH